MSRPSHARTTRRARKKREGAALLIVMFILMMATGTAMYALQSTQFEQRAAGSLHQAMRTKYVTEAATVGVLAFCDQATVERCVDEQGTTVKFEAMRPKYALPDRGEEEVYALDPDSLADPAFVAPVLATDADILDTGGQATTYTPRFVSFVEKWDVTSPNDNGKRYRVIISTYGEVSIGALEKATDHAEEFRAGHESISATRAFFDLRNQ